MAPNLPFLVAKVIYLVIIFKLFIVILLKLCMNTNDKHQSTIKFILKQIIVSLKKQQMI